MSKACKLEVPRTSKRTIQHNPWITSGIIVAISHCDKLYNASVKYKKKNAKRMRLIIGEVHACAIYAMINVNIIQHVKNTVKLCKGLVKMQDPNSIQENLMKNLGI